MRYNKLAFFLCVSLLLLQDITIFTHNNFSSEEGSVYFLYAYTNPWWKTILAPQLGYFSIIPNLGAVIGANLLPLEYASYAGLIIMMGVLWITITLITLPGSPFKSDLTKILASMALVPAFILQTPYAHFYASLWGLIIALSDLSENKMFYRFAIALSCLTGILMAFLLPLYFWRGWIEREREFKWYTMAIGMVSLAQFCIFVFRFSAILPSDYNNSRFSFLAVDHAAAILLNVGYIRLFLGNIGISTGHFLEDALATHRLITSILVIIGLGGIIYGWSRLRLPRNKEPFAGQLHYAALLGGMLLAVCSIYAGTTAGQSKLSLLYSHGRYFMIPRLSIIYALLIALDRIKRISICTGVLCAAMIANAVNYAHHIGFSKGWPSWKSEIKIWSTDHNHKLVIWPPAIWPPIKL